jgi:Zn-dependent metalloprotease
MGMVNSEWFGPYEPGIVIHEATHSLFDIQFSGQSGSVSESICNVIAVAIRGGDWTIGKVRTRNPAVSQALFSLQSPGQAYDNPILGHDPQVSHMTRYYSGPEDNGELT